MTPPDTQSASRAAEEIAAGRLTAVDLLDSCTQQIARHNPAINALVTLDLDKARQSAEAADAILQRTGRPDDQALLGIPISVKDAFATQGLRTTSSFPPLADYIPAGDATVVARLKAAGADGCLSGLSPAQIPAGIVEGLPVGLQVVGRRWQEDRILQCSQILEDCLGTNPPPALAI